MRKRLMQRGDTIIEVLIAITVVSSVLAVTYSIMNKNLLIAQDSQERTEATKIAQGQIELLKSHRDQSDNSVLSGTYCLTDPSTPAITGFTGGSPTLGTPDNFANYPVLCKGTAISPNGLYNVAITASLGTYKIYVRWDKIHGGGQNEVVMVYKL